MHQVTSYRDRIVDSNDKLLTEVKNFLNATQLNQTTNLYINIDYDETTRKIITLKINTKEGLFFPFHRWKNEDLKITFKGAIFYPKGIRNDTFDKTLCCKTENTLTCGVPNEKTGPHQALLHLPEGLTEEEHKTADAIMLIVKKRLEILGQWDHKDTALLGQWDHKDTALVVALVSVPIFIGISFICILK